MHFALVDTVLEAGPDRVLAVKQVTLAEEYLQDHFPTFHVLPGVFMLEALVQSARHILEARGKSRWVLGGVRALRYGSFVRPGESLVMEVALEKEAPDGSITFKGLGTVRRQATAGGAEPETAVSGRFTMRPLRVPPQTAGSA
jgi:3-hydroxyacyl-[acyl-carrier-protein] dehydratase